MKKPIVLLPQKALLDMAAKEISVVELKLNQLARELGDMLDMERKLKPNAINEFGRHPR